MCATAKARPTELPQRARLTILARVQLPPMVSTRRAFPTTGSARLTATVAGKGAWRQTPRLVPLGPMWCSGMPAQSATVADRLTLQIKEFRAAVCRLQKRLPFPTAALLSRTKSRISVPLKRILLTRTL